MPSNKQKYSEWLKSQPDIPIFFQDWWLDVAAGKGKWDVAIVEKGEHIIGVLPYAITTKLRFTSLQMPKLTPFLGPWVIFQKNQKYTKRLSYEKKVLTELINSLPSYAKFSQNFHYNFTNWLPFYWKNFSADIRYTYILNKAPIEDVYKNLLDKTRWELNKSKKTLQIYESTDINTFYTLFKETFTRQKKKVPFSYSEVENIDGVLADKQCRKIFFCKDPDNNIHAAAYFIWDNNSIYYLLSGSNDKYLNSGARNLLIWEGIKFALSNNKIFNFEGSMYENIETAFRSFGSLQKPYFKLYRYNSILLKIKSSIHQIFSK